MKDPFDQDTHDFVSSLPPIEELITPIRREPGPAPTPANVTHYPDSFKDYPRSVADAKSDKTQKAADWSPRDALIDVLRELDAGRIKPTALMVIWAEIDPAIDRARTCRRVSSPNAIITQGMVADQLGR